MVWSRLEAKPTNLLLEVGAKLEELVRVAQHYGQLRYVTNFTPIAALFLDIG